jgi:hypothetical protein
MTDHRAQAANFLEAAHTLHNRAETSERAITCALLGIGHWLGAIHDALLALSKPTPQLVTLDSEAVVSPEQADAIRAILREND